MKTEDTEVKPVKLYTKLAVLVGAKKNAEKFGNADWGLKHAEAIRSLCDEHLPHGSGIDAGVQLDIDQSSVSRLVIKSSFHKMNETGTYDGWADFTVEVTADLLGMLVEVSADDGLLIEHREYLGDIFHEALSKDIMFLKGDI